MSFSRNERAAAWGALLGIALVGCTGGQSGSEDSDSQACPYPEEAVELGPDERPPADLGGGAMSPRELLAKFAGPTSIDGVWFNTEEPNSITVELSRTPTASTFHPCMGLMLIDTTATIRTSDGALDLTIPVRTLNGAGFSVALPELPSTVVGDPLWAPDEAWTRMELGRLVPSDGPSPSLGVQLSSDVLHPRSRAVVIQDHMVVGAWADEGLPITGPPTLYTPPPELAGSCVGAEEFQTPLSQPGFEYTPFSSAEAAFGAEVGTWVRCADSAASERAGIQILADGTWRDLALESGELVARTGFDHEGTTSAEATQGDPPDLYMLFFSGGSGNWGAVPVSNRALVVPSTTNYWPPTVYLPTTLPVRVPPSQFVDGEKAGAAGCKVEEQGIVAGVDEAAAALEGTFVFCSGDFGAGTMGIRFAGGKVERLGEGGVVLEAPSYEFEREMNPNIVSLRLSDGRYWLVNVSRSPRKLWLQAADLNPWPTAAVFSAIP